MNAVGKRSMSDVRCGVVMVETELGIDEEIPRFRTGINL